MAPSTTGRNAAASLSLDLALKNSVAAVSPPPRIFRASSKVMAAMASKKISLADGAARSAARFMLSTSSSTCEP